MSSEVDNGNLPDWGAQSSEVVGVDQVRGSCWFGILTDFTTLY
jgi:hypothetical protein